MRIFYFTGCLMVYGYGQIFKMVSPKTIAVLNTESVSLWKMYTQSVIDKYNKNRSTVSKLHNPSKAFVKCNK
jgi:hypothetical protein